MRNLILTSAVAMMTATASFAGGLSPTIDTVDVVVDKPASSVSPLLILGLIILIGVLVSRNDDNDNVR